MSLPRALLIAFSSNANFKWYILRDTWSRKHHKKLFKLNFVYKLWLIPSWWTNYRKTTQPLCGWNISWHWDCCHLLSKVWFYWGKIVAAMSQEVKRDCLCKKTTTVSQSKWHTWWIRMVMSASHENGWGGVVPGWLNSSWVGSPGSRLLDTGLWLKASLQNKTEIVGKRIKTTPTQFLDSMVLIRKGISCPVAVVWTGAICLCTG